MSKTAYNKQNIQSRIESTLSLCKRAGKLVMGFDLVKSAMGSGTAQVVVFASDLSPKTKKELAYISEQLSMPIHAIDITLDQLWFLIGKRAGILAVTDEGLGNTLLEELAYYDKKDEAKE